MNINTREEWMLAAIKELSPIFENNNAPLPEKIRVSIGFTSKGFKGKSIGECWDNKCSKDEHYEIFIRPDYCYEENFSIQVLATLAHELIHAALGISEGHGKNFKRVYKAIGLSGRVTATYAGPEFVNVARKIIEKIGDVPHGIISANGLSTRKKTAKKQISQMPML